MTGDPSQRKRKPSVLVSGLGLVVVCGIFGLMVAAVRYVTSGRGASDMKGVPVLLTVITNPTTRVTVVSADASRPAIDLGDTPLDKSSGAQVGDTVVLENRDLGLRHEVRLEFGGPYEEKKIAKVFPGYSPDLPQAGTSRDPARIEQPVLGPLPAPPPRTAAQIWAKPEIQLPWIAVLQSNCSAYKGTSDRNQKNGIAKQTEQLLSAASVLGAVGILTSKRTDLGKSADGDKLILQIDVGAAKLENSVAPIEQGTAVHAAADRIAEGQCVVFSAKQIEADSILEASKVCDLDFTAAFTELAKCPESLLRPPEAPGEWAFRLWECEGIGTGTNQRFELGPQGTKVPFSERTPVASQQGEMTISRFKHGSRKAAITDAYGAKTGQVRETQYVDVRTAKGFWDGFRLGVDLPGRRDLGVTSRG